MDLLKNLNNMITAESFINQWITKPLDNNDVENLMIEFAKLHVTEAKKEYHKVLVKQGIVTDAGIGYFDNVYSLDNIK